MAIRYLVGTLLCLGLLVADPHRPAYHFQPPANWMNDTMGVYWKGEFHIFYLYNPDGPYWRQAKEWGHAYSTDLLHWKLLPTALGPVPNGPENLCCQTGSVTIANGIPTAFYTCAPGICMATSEDNLRTWRRNPANPVIPGPPPGLDVYGFRDPFLFHRDDAWYLLQGSGIRNSGGAIFLYKSPDLHTWQYLHPLLPGLGKSDEVWEVPGLFRLGAKDVLIYSPTKESKYTRYFLGSYTNQQFTPELQGKMDFGGYFYAATTFPANGRRIMIAWIKEGRSKEDVLKAGWSGMLSVPRELSLTAGGRLQLEPAAEVNALRGRQKHYANLQLASGKTMPVAAQGDTLDIVAEFDPGDASRFGLKVRQSPAGEEETLVYFDRKESRFVMDTTHSSQSSGVDRKILADAFDFAPGKPLRLRILVDRSVIEAFAEKRAAVSGRVYPSLPSSLGVQPFAEGGAATLRSLDIWEMKGSQ